MRGQDDGFSLIEAIVALALLAGALVALADLLALSTRLNMAARLTTRATVLAAQKMEQLRSLAWGFDPFGLPTSDLATDVALIGASAGGCGPARPGAARGLSASPGDTLSANVDGYVDFVDGRGCPLGGGARSPAGAMFVRRWAVAVLDGSNANSIVLTVRVLPWRDAISPGSGRVPGEVRLVTIRTRKM
jgi:prepilin-type N-terminal cleavage/methylation domain-containing protein